MALISKASLLMVPSTYENGKLFNVLPSGNRAPDSTDQNSGYDQTRADFDFDRGSNLGATRINSSGLIEKGRENLLLQSNAFDTTWTNSNSSETSGQSGYDGTNDAWKLTKSAANGYIQQQVTFVGVNTLSVYVKADSSNWVALMRGDGQKAFFDLSGGGALGTVTSGITSKIESVGNDWFRCSFTFSNSSTNYARIYVADGDNDTSGTSGNILIQSAQLESGTIATDYIASGATTGKAGILADMPRINYDANGENGSLLLEGLRSNVITQSEYFGGSEWAKGSVSITTNDATSPDGLGNASKVTFNNAFHFLIDSVAVSSNTKYTFSFYIKRGTATDLKYRLRDATNSADIIAPTSYYSQTSSSEWKRIEVDFTTPATCTSLSVYPFSDGGTLGDVYIWGAQMEAATYASSYIPTHGAAVSRSADSCSVTGVSDVIGQTEGAAYVEIMYNNGGDAGVDCSFFGLKNSAGTSYLNIYRLNSTLAFRFFNAGANQFFHTETPTNETLLKIAFAYKANDFALYINGVQEATDTSGSVAGMSEVHLAGFSVGDNITDNYKTILFKERLTNAELATLTTL